MRAVPVALALAACLATAAQAHEREIVIVKEPNRTTKTITEDGVKIYENTWATRADGKSVELGPGWLKKGAGGSWMGGSAPPPSPPRMAPPRVQPVTRTPPRARPASQRPASQAASVALSLVGVRYKHGGSDPASGLNSVGVPYAFFQKMGVSVSNEMKALYRLGEFQMKTQIQPGDMVFHASAGKHKDLPDMVGIAVNKTEMVYMSFSKKKVIRTSFDSPYWVQRYKGARRVLGTKYATPVGGSPYVPPSQRTFTGVASFYGCGDGFDNSGTASGEVFDAMKMTAAHKTLPLQTRLKVTHLGNGRTVNVRINDRGPYVDGRVLDLSCGAARILKMTGAGLATVRAEVIGSRER